MPGHYFVDQLLRELNRQPQRSLANAWDRADHCRFSLWFATAQGFVPPYVSTLDLLLQQYDVATREYFHPVLASRCKLHTSFAKELFPEYAVEQLILLSQRVTAMSEFFQRNNIASENALLDYVVSETFDSKEQALNSTRHFEIYNSEWNRFLRDCIALQRDIAPLHHIVTVPERMVTENEIALRALSEFRENEFDRLLV